MIAHHFIQEVHIHARTTEVRNYIVARGQRKSGENVNESDYVDIQTVAVIMMVTVIVCFNIM